MLAVKVWSEKLKNKSVYYNCDNKALVLIHNKHTSKEPQIMFLIRNRVFCFALKYNILFIPGKYNTLSDVHSRLQVIKSRSLMPEAD